MRIKEARERIGLDQVEAARRLGVKAHVLSNLEKCRAPLRFDLALRFCRELFVNEEWLATGRTEALEHALRNAAKSREGSVSPWTPVFFRTPLNLAGHASAGAIPPRTLFSEAFERYLKPVVADLSRQAWMQPPISFSPYDRPEFRAEFLAILIERWRAIIRFRAEEKGLPDGAQQLVEWDLVDDLTLAGMLIFYRSCGIPTPFQTDPRFNFLRVLASDETTPIGTLASVEEVTVTKDGRVSFASAKPHKHRRPCRSKR